MSASDSTQYSPSRPRPDWYSSKGSYTKPHIHLDDFTRPFPASNSNSYLASAWCEGELRENVTTAPGPEAPLRKPTNSVRNFDRSTVIQDARNTCIVVHARFPELVDKFLQHKRQHGSPVEKEFYGQHGWSWSRQVARLIEKRPLVFMNSSDFTVLRDYSTLPDTSEWDFVGKTDGSGDSAKERNRYLFLKDYLSYDEIMLGSLLGASGPSYFVNNGSRTNLGNPGKPGSFEERGIIVGLVGARFERPDRMDSIFCLPRSISSTLDVHSSKRGSGSRPQKSPEMDPGLVDVFTDWFCSVSGDQVRVDPLEKKFHAGMYKARMRVTIDVLLLEASERARAAGKKAYTHVVGLGLGVWALYGVGQEQYYIETFADALHELGNDSMRHIGTIDFSYIKAEPKSSVEKVTAAAAKHGINVRFSRRNPADKLSQEEAGQLLVVSYAWDGNAFPGNEYWVQMPSASGDPAAACMSTISELHNPLTNPGFLRRIKVLGGQAPK
ncbi:hypothetical protein Micbo1qcDRAFT_167154 [Microdochium bolleyi]|uniref:Uncharacterized protein n=1 Tax=Microdochium bolleyi TaxID=196109 RepID=A0A136IRU6_9PEZI|nr:hypothetical protein Micbo1qcDRAFT_167154 [Microdochium bolleyi]